MFRKILVAHDGSEGAQKAFAAALDLAARCQGELHMISVREVHSHFASTMGEVMEEKDEENKLYAQVKQDASRMAAERGVRLQVKILTGHSGLPGGRPGLARHHRRNLRRAFERRQAGGRPLHRPVGTAQTACTCGLRAHHTGHRSAGICRRHWACPAGSRDGVAGTRRAHARPQGAVGRGCPAASLRPCVRFRAHDGHTRRDRCAAHRALAAQANFA